MVYKTLNYGVQEIIICFTLYLVFIFVCTSDF